MKKIFATFFLIFLFCDTGFAQNYYFKDCKLSEAVSGDYLIDLKTNTIKVTLKSIDGTVQEFIDKIKLVTKDRIVSEIVQQKNKKFATQYFLDSNSKSVIRQLYKREIEIDLVRPEGPRKIGYCANVKSGWYKSKEEIVEEKENEIRRGKLISLATICKLKILHQYVFRNSNPAVFGAAVEGGKAKPGTPLMDELGNKIAKLRDVQENNKKVPEAEKGKEIAISLPGLMFDRVLADKEYLYSDLTENQFKKFIILFFILGIFSFFSTFFILYLSID